MGLKSKINTVWEFIKSRDNLFDNYSGKGLYSEKNEVNTFKSKEITPSEMKIISLIEEGTVLDVGCAAGIVPREIAKKGFEVTGIDISEEMIEKAKRLVIKDKMKPNFVAGNMANLPFKDETFDYVLCLCNTITYLPKKEERENSLKEMARVLKKKGTLLITLSNFKHPPLLLKIVLFWIFGLFAKRKVYLGDMLTNVRNSKNVVYQHYFSKKELNKLLIKKRFSTKWIDEKELVREWGKKEMFKNWSLIIAKK